MSAKLRRTGRMRPVRVRRALICQAGGKGRAAIRGSAAGRRTRGEVRFRWLAGNRNSGPREEGVAQGNRHFNAGAARLAPQGRGVMRRWQRPKGARATGASELECAGPAVLCASSRCKGKGRGGSLRRCLAPQGQGALPVCGVDAVCPCGAKALQSGAPDFGRVAGESCLWSALPIRNGWQARREDGSMPSYAP